MTDTLAPNLQAYLDEMVKAQKTGKFNALMGYTPAKALAVGCVPIEKGEVDYICEGITRDDLRKLERAGYISVNSPRSTWTLKLRAKALEAAGR